MRDEPPVSSAAACLRAKLYSVSARASKGSPAGRALVTTAWAAAGVVLVALVLRAAASKGYYWADDYGHLEISRSAWAHPVWLLDVWGRPLMTLAYMPSAPWGDGAVRATSLVMFALTGGLCVSIARLQGTRVPVVAGCLLLVQPVAARVAFSALPYTVFSLVLALGLWLRAAGRHRAAALMIALLPLARLEGLVVVAAWSVVTARERRWRDLPLLGVGMLAWAAVGAVVHHDLLWIADANPYGVTSSRYGAAGWGYFWHAFPIAVGPIVGGLVIAAVALKGLKDSLVATIAVGLIGFYTLAWGLGWFQTDSVPVYLVTASVPFALIAHQVVAALSARRALLRGGGMAVAGALAVVAIVVEGRVVDIAVAAVVAGVLAMFLYGRRFPELRLIAVAGIVVMSAVVGVALTDSLPLNGGALASKRLASSLGDRADDVLAWTHPAFGWYAGRTRDEQFRRFQDAPVGSLVVYDSEYGPAFIKQRRLRRLGFVPVQTEMIGGETVALWQRRAGREPTAR